LSRQLISGFSADEIADALCISARWVREPIKNLFGFQQAFGLQMLEDLRHLRPERYLQTLRAQDSDLFRQVGFNLAPQAGATEHGWAAAVVQTVYKNWIAQRRGVVHQMTVRIEESSAAVDVKQRVNTYMIKHVFA